MPHWIKEILIEMCRVTHQREILTHCRMKLKIHNFFTFAWNPPLEGFLYKACLRHLTSLPLMPLSPTPPAYIRTCSSLNVICIHCCAPICHRQMLSSLPSIIHVSRSKPGAHRCRTGADNQIMPRAPPTNSWGQTGGPAGTDPLWLLHAYPHQLLLKHPHQFI